MRNLKLIFTVVCAAFFTVDTNAQMAMDGPGYPIGSEWDCTADVPFTDQGGAGNYTANYNDTITFCPTLACGNPGDGLNGTKMTVAFAINAGFTWDVDGSDSVYVYDGPDANSPLLGVHNSATDPNGVTHTASWNNPSGCLTLVFITDGANEGTGWDANVSCGFVNQPFDPHIEAYINGVGPNALDPADTGYVDVCFGDSILFIAKPDFPNSCETTAAGYSQTIDNVNYDWYISDGGTYANNDSIWFTPPTRNGFLVDLSIEDLFPQIERMLCKVRVSQQPLFTGTGPLEDTVCLGQNTQLVGGVTPTDTVGIDIPGGTFQLGGSFAGLTYLPDGSGAQYQAPIDISGFPAGATIANSQDLNQVCITMEHSYVGDLEIALECPNGTQVTLLNSFDGGIGFIPGGTSGGGTYMGDPIDDVGGGGPGEGWEYCFSSVFNTWGDYPTELGAGNTIPAPINGGGGASMNPNGVYLPEDDFVNFAGCPINGQWTIIVQDNLGTDDGYIFEWGLFFDPSFFPGSGSYQNTVASEDWASDPTIVSGQNDTLLVVQPDTPGNYDYVYQIVDDFGCAYDTTVTLYVLPQPSIFGDTLACNLLMDAVGTQSYEGGVWAAVDTAIHFTDTSLENPSIWTSLAGTYTVTYTDNACNTTVSSDITFPPFSWTAVDDTIVCQGTEYVAFANENYTVDNFVWSTGDTGPSIVVTEPGSYTVTGSNICHSYSATAFIDFKVCDIEAPNIISLSSANGNNFWFVQQDGLSEFKCTITNRWGNLIYEFTDPTGSWDGKTMSGATVEEGTYFYIIDARIEGGDLLQKHGFIQVVH
ncbi:MAG: gliding motility-associated C-terminal domain-containing protein [Crocinitomicaceae bacterium]|nr:gliding motility-associated C-terminal domain-containing protein [Crocinitomicaceae bacterium]